MSFSFDDEPFTADCPNCGKPISNKAKWFKRDEIMCPHCGTTLGTAQFKSTLEGAEEAMKRLSRELSKTKFDINL